MVNFTTQAGQLSSGHSVFRGMVLMSLAMLVIPGLDVFAKLLTETMSAGQVVWYRFFIQTILLTPFMIYFRLWSLPRGTLLLQFLRGILLAIATLFFFAALKYLSIAEAIAIFFVEPLILTILGVLFLGEVIRFRRISAIIVGFIGALFIIQPSFSDVGLPAFFPLATALSFAFYLLLTRHLSGRVNAYQMQWMVGVSATLVMSVVLLWGDFADIAIFAPALPVGVEITWILCLGVIATLGHLTIVYAMRHASASVLAPFQYVEIIGATVFGYFVFGDVLDIFTGIGVFIIVSSGLYLFHRERQLMKAS